MPYELMPDEAPAAEEESILSQAGRGITRTASRVGEQIAGAPGDIFSLVNDYIAKPATELITGKKGVPYEQTQLGKVLPTTEEHRKRTKKAFGEYTEPQNKIEKFVDDIVSDATSFAIPGLKGSKLGSKAMKSLAISTAANTLGEVTKDWTADEKKAGMVKLGSLFTLSLFDKPRAAQTVAELYKPLSKKVVNMNPVNGTGLEFAMQNLQDKMTKGTMSTGEKFIFEEAGEILSKIKNGKITPEELWAVKRSLNAKLSETLFKIPKKDDQKGVRKLSGIILHEVDEALKLTAKQDPKFYKDLKQADKAFGTIAQSNWISNYIENNMKYNPLTAGLMHAFSGPIGSTAATAALPYQAMKILYRISKSPVLAKHYAKVLSSAAKDNSIIMNREMKKLDKELQKEQKKDKFVLID